MNRIKIDFAYDGKNFSGFQSLEGKRTVQGTLEEALSKLLGEDIKITASGRTDAGVSAIHQVAHFDTNSTIIATNICFAVNKLLPSDVQVFASKKVSDKFHARFSAKSKTYRYMVYESRHINPVYQNYMYRCEKELNLEKMVQASKFLIGKHNFKAFATKDKNVNNFTREIYSINIEKKDNIISLTINGNAFLYNMVRIIVGSLIDVGLGKIEPSKIKDILKSQERKNAGKLVDAYPLTLVKVFY